MIQAWTIQAWTIASPAGAAVLLSGLKNKPGM
jgi:hypothetical protein